MRFSFDRYFSLHSCPSSFLFYLPSFSSLSLRVFCTALSQRSPSLSLQQRLKTFTKDLQWHSLPKAQCALRLWSAQCVAGLHLITQAKVRENDEEEKKNERKRKGKETLQKVSFVLLMSPFLYR
jgi:hypothetical protein